MLRRLPLTTARRRRAGTLTPFSAACDKFGQPERAAAAPQSSTLRALVMAPPEGVGVPLSALGATHLLWGNHPLPRHTVCAAGAAAPDLRGKKADKGCACAAPAGLNRMPVDKQGKPVDWAAPIRTAWGFGEARSSSDGYSRLFSTCDSGRASHFA